MTLVHVNHELHDREALFSSAHLAGTSLVRDSNAEQDTKSLDNWRFAGDVTEINVRAECLCEWFWEACRCKYDTTKSVL